MSPTVISVILALCSEHSLKAECISYVTLKQPATEVGAVFSYRAFDETYEKCRNSLVFSTRKCVKEEK